MLAGQQFQVMFDWCRKVDIYNIENHYHFYGHQNLPQGLSPVLEFSRLKPAPIGLTTHPLPKSNPPLRKGIRLTSNASYEGSHISSNSLSRSGSLKPASVSIGRQSNNLKCLEPQIAEGGTMQTDYSEHVLKTKSELPIDNIRVQRRSSAPKTNIQVLLATKKPSVPQVVSKMNFTFLPPLTLKNLTSTMDATNVSYIKNCQPVEPQIQKERLNIINVSTSRHIDSPCPSSRRGSQQHSNYEGSSGSEKRTRKQSLEPTWNNHFVEASLILSQILSRDCRNQTISEEQYQSSRSPNRLRVTNLWQEQDRVTIVSNYNDAGSEVQYRVEESLLCEHDAKQNFELLKSTWVESEQYQLGLGREISVGCLVSLKQVDLSRISCISQEIHIYGLLEESTGKSPYEHILQLYQVQICHNSYLFIKEPYTEGPFSKCTTKPAMLCRIKEAMASLLKSLGELGIHPNRYLRVRDFVECASVIKVHELSGFERRESPIFTLEELANNLESQGEI